MQEVGIKDFSITLMGENDVFYPGQEITGFVNLDLSRSIIIFSIQVSLKGTVTCDRFAKKESSKQATGFCSGEQKPGIEEEQVSLMDKIKCCKFGGNGSSKRPLDEPSSEEHKPGKEERVTLIGTLKAKYFGGNASTEEAPEEEQPFIDFKKPVIEEVFKAERYLVGSSSEKETSGIGVNKPTGKYTFDFSFKLSSDKYSLPSSFEGKWGHIRYDLNAKMDSKGVEACEFNLPVKVTETIDTNRSMYKEGHGGSAKAVGGCFNNTGRFEISGSVDRVCYLPGEDILIDATIVNEIGKKVKVLKAKLYQKIVYQYKPKAIVEKKTVKKMVSPAIPKGEVKTKVWDKQKFPVPDSLIPNISADILQVKYCLKFGIPGTKVEIPVVIGTVKNSPPNLKISQQQGEVSDAEKSPDTTSITSIKSPTSTGTSVSEDPRPILISITEEEEDEP